MSSSTFRKNKKKSGHQENRKKICCVCFSKQKSVIIVKEHGELFNRIKEKVHPNLNFEDERYPTGLCQRCKKILFLIELGKKTDADLPQNLFDHTKIVLQSKTRKSIADCDCAICQKGRDIKRKMKKKDDVLTKTVCTKCEGNVAKGQKHVCTAMQRRKNILKRLQSDTKEAEIICSSMLKNKAANVSSSLMKLRSGNQQLVNVDISKETTRALYDNKPIPKSEVNMLKLDTGMSDRSIRKTCHYIRSWKGRQVFEAGASKEPEDDFASELFDIVDIELDGEEKSLVYCTDVKELINKLKEERKLTEGSAIKIGMDGGGGFFKVCLNIVEKEDTNNAHKKSKFSYRQGAQSKNFQNGGVKKLIILAMAKDTKENYQNVSMIIKKLKLDDVKYYCIFDFKLANIFFGIESCSSSHPCVFCEATSENVKVLNGRNCKRTLGSIRRNSKDYKEACKSFLKKGKLTAKPFKNCVHNPLITSPDSTEVINVFPPGELHLFTGVFNRIYNLVQENVFDNLHNFNMATWASSCGMERSGQYGGQFTGNQCSKLLENLEALSVLANSQGPAPDNFANYMSCLQALKEVKGACMGQAREQNYKLKIDELKRSFLVLGVPATPKIHILVEHVPEFLEQYNGLGLGFFSEQASESVHADFKEFYARGFKVNSDQHCLYKEKLLRCVVKYNNLHF